MSGFGGFGGFGQSNNTQQQSTTGFGGFGTTPSTNSGFGTTPNTGFGSSLNSGAVGSFGSTGAFGNTSNNAFGTAKPSGFGITPSSGGGLFGNSNTTTNNAFGSGGFGSTAPSTSFGGNNAGSGLFGASNTPFGGTSSSNTTAFGTPAQSAIDPTGAGECQGTGSLPFQAFVEKEPNSSTSQQNSFQNIAFQPPYQKFSMEELRLADYNQGRRFGNGSNQPGAFGQSNFGGFGTSNTGFGATNNTTGATMFGSGTTSTPFGASQPSTTGFGSNTTNGGGLFGAKPSTGGLFGSQPSNQPSGGIFGNTSNTGFGTQNTSAFNSNSTNSGGSLFGQNPASKPTFSFGNVQPTTTTSTGFGALTSTGGFGGGGIFGNNQQSATPNFGPQPATNNTFGDFGTNNQPNGQTSLFGNTQPKPTSGLFSTPATTASTGLFGNTQPTPNTNAFGAPNNTANSGGLFGSKPSTTGPDNLFGSSVNTQSNTSGGLFGGFGNQPQNQQPSGGLFGGLSNNNNEQKPSIFGNAQPASGSSLFGNSTSQQQTSLFGGFNNNQQPSQPPQNSLFGNNNSSFSASTQNQQAPQSLTASIADNTAFGSQSLFSNIAATQVSNPGPIATPLTGSRSNVGSKSAALPLYKLNSGSGSRFSTPQKRGFGLSYSTFGSPASVNSAASTPGAFTSSTTLGSGSFSRTLNKSMSTSSLRRSFNAEDSILAPGAFSAGSSNRHFGSTGSVKKLTINKNIRSDLFTPLTPQSQPNSSTPSSGILKKRVSFDANINGNGIAASSPLKQVNTATPSSAELGYLRPHSSSNSINSNDTPSETQQVPNSNNQLAIVREEESVDLREVSIPESLADKNPGDYWMTPSKSEIENMNRVQRQKVSGLTVGRHGVGSVQFDVPVDLTCINLDDIMDNIVKIDIRQVTVYPDNHKKPPMGKGLNVPSTITLENSWPRKKDRKTPLTDQSGSRLQKHIEKLKRVEDTEFVSYEKTTGTWTFRVPHFTTYGCPDEDDDDMENIPSTVTIVSKHKNHVQNSPRSNKFNQESVLSELEDTFEFKKHRKSIPGTFDNQEIFDDEHLIEDNELVSYAEDHFICSKSEHDSDNGIEEPKEPDSEFDDNESVGIIDQDMVGTYPEANHDMDLINSDQSDLDKKYATNNLSSLDRSRFGTLTGYTTPPKPQFLPGDDWISALQATISPKKQDRGLLKSLVQLEDEQLEADIAATPTKNLCVNDGRGFATRIDLMNSLFGEAGSQDKAMRAFEKKNGFEWSHPSRSKTSKSNNPELKGTELSFHQSMKPSWGPDGILIYAAPIPRKSSRKYSKNNPPQNDLLAVVRREIVSEHRDVRFAKFSSETSADLLEKHKQVTVIEKTLDTPIAAPSENLFFTDYFDDNAPDHEKLVWQLASILWDPFPIPDELQDIPHIISRLRKDKLSHFWEKLVNNASTRQVALARTHEEKAIACLSGHKIDEACCNLTMVGDFHLSVLVALLGGKDSIKRDIQTQLESWRKSKILSEMSQPLRALYEIIAGNICVCDEVKGPIEDRAEAFSISKRFGLDWRQAFGLRLWYGTLSSEPIEAAVENYAQDLSAEKEESWPNPWYVEQKVPALWQDPCLDLREDLLWGILKLYTFEDADLEDILRPENSQLSPMDFRLSWQLSQAIISSGSVKFAGDNNKNCDGITLSFASQLINEGNWIDAIFVLLHLTSTEARLKAIKDLLGRNAGDIGTDISQNFITLTKNFKLPESWIWEAKALYVRSVEKNPRGEVEYLIKAGLFNEAHQTFSKEVAPKTIVELDYNSLKKLLAGFEGKKATIVDWHLGGGLYQDYLELIESEKYNRPINDLVLERLLCGLPTVMEDLRHPNFMEAVAVETMSATVAKAVLNRARKGAKNSLAVILRLPLTEDNYLKHSIELSSEYYRSLLSIK